VAALSQIPAIPGQRFSRVGRNGSSDALSPTTRSIPVKTKSTNTGFRAAHVTVCDEGEYFLVGFADDQFDTHEYFMLQLAHEFDEQDIRLGMDDVYIVRNDQIRSAYGGIIRFELMRDRVRVSLDERTAKKLRGGKEMEVQFDLDAEKFRELRSGLAKLFEGRSCFIDAT
jgi:hypothetical protein